ncbi:hypothetical protein N2152v2_007632 [Parachlorella kessleri]
MDDTEELAARAAKRRKLLKDASAAAGYRRGQPIATRKIEDKKLKGKLQYQEKLVNEAQVAAAKVDEWLLPGEAGSLEAEGLERTWRFQQEDIVQAAEEGAGKKVFDLSLPELGPYRLDLTRSGRHMVLGGRKGHLAMLDWQRSQIVCELQVRETTHDVQFLHNDMFFAAAQKKYVYIYDKRGLEVHCLKEHTDVRRLGFLPHHFLLTSIGTAGVLRYQDTSTGTIIAQHRTKLGPCSVMQQNPWNGVMVLGHGNGTVSMWTPNITTPVLRMLCHHGPVRSVAVDAPGRHLVTTGADGQVKVWDVRTFRELHAYYSPAPVEWADISQRGLLAVGYGRRVQVWKDALSTKAQSPYMTHRLLNGTLQDLHFCPYEDVLLTGHSGGVSSMLVPGAGEPHYDTFVADPYAGRKARREAEVVQLLDKLQPEMIVLDPGTIGQVLREPAEVQKERAAEAAAANAAKRKEVLEEGEKKTKMKGKNKPTRRQKKRQQNIVEERKPLIKQRMKEQGVAAEFGGSKQQQKEQQDPAVPSNVPRALHRFYKK